MMRDGSQRQRAETRGLKRAVPESLVALKDARAVFSGLPGLRCWGLCAQGFIS